MTEDQIDQLREAGKEIEDPPELFSINQQAWDLYLAVQEQYEVLGYIKDKKGKIEKAVKALRIEAIKNIMDIYEIEEKAEMLEKIQLIFRELNK